MRRGTGFGAGGVRARHGVWIHVSLGPAAVATAYIHQVMQNMRPSQIVATHEQGVDLEDWTSITNASVREALRWLCYTAAHPFFVVSARMKFYGGPAYSSMTQVSHKWLLCASSFMTAVACVCAACLGSCTAELPHYHRQ